MEGQLQISRFLGEPEPSTSKSNKRNKTETYNEGKEGPVTKIPTAENCKRSALWVFARTDGRRG